MDSLADTEFKRSVYEGFDADNKTHYYHYLRNRLYSFPGVSEQQLIRWDQNIVSHTLAISEKRDEPIQWLYFQYVSLLFTELYLELLFSDSEGLREDLNSYVESWNNPLDATVPNESDFICQPFEADELKRLAFWNATGSGKTLLMHVNIKQYLHYIDLYGRRNDLNKVILVTPNEGLSDQHLQEFDVSGIDAEIFSKASGGLFSGQKVEIIEISKLAEEGKEKTIAVESFESNNLVLVDEGHRGLGGDVYKKNRDLLSENGFAFEYSATFGQSVAASGTQLKKSLMQEYSKSILMDYSYKFFYEDGYGKDYYILNVPDHTRQTFTRKYLTGSLLAYYQQHKVFKDHPNLEPKFQVYKPLWVFVGGKVNAVRTEDGNPTSDVLKILHFFRDFIRDTTVSKEYLGELLTGKDGVHDENDRPVFAALFSYLNQSGLTVDDVYTDILETVFNTELVGAEIHLDLLKGQDGELGLRIGDNGYFGVINVGDASKLFKLCTENGITGEEKDFCTSLFKDINEKKSAINLLIGSKKFTEGWSSWRVSTMGLMNIGRSEGSQIIQLFGRGVRLKGYQTSLKRSTKLDPDQRPEGKIPAYLRNLETLQVFGIRADYMQQFKEFLEEEGLPSNDSRFINVELPVMISTDLGTVKLKVLKVKEGTEFKKNLIVNLRKDTDVGSKSVVVEWYPKVQFKSTALSQHAILPEMHENTLDEKHLAFVNWDVVFFELQKFKRERTWYNLTIEQAVLQEIIRDNNWYSLRIPEGELIPNSFQKVREWQQIVIALLKGYTERYYNLVKSGYLSERMETVELTPGHPNFMEEYQVQVEESRQDIIDKLLKIKEVVKKKEPLDKEEIQKGFTVFKFFHHLYEPLIYLDAKKYQDVVKVSPVALNKGEFEFVQHLKAYYQRNTDFFQDKSLYLLRNASRKGVGFFEANGFYPDFILWLIKDDHQYITFIDPKGLRQVNGFENPKLRFHKTVKENIESRIHEVDTHVTLDAFIVSPTTFDEVRHWRGGERISDFNDRHVYFMKDQENTYIESILNSIIEEALQD